VAENEAKFVLGVGQEADEKKTHEISFNVQGWGPDAPEYSLLFNVTHIPCHRLTI
jgi:hypothetical protein